MIRQDSFTGLAEIEKQSDTLVKQKNDIEN